MIKRLYRQLFWKKNISQPENVDEAINQLKDVKRYEPGTINFLNHQLRYTDSASLVFTYREIFKNEIYRFSSTCHNPYIIDAGANIGISVLYFKFLFPNSEIIAFEPDQKIYDILEQNVKEFDLKNVKLINKGLWSEDKELLFFSEGADAGRISLDSHKPHNNKVQVTRLRDYLRRPVDLLKIDIEGAETVVLKDCQDMLYNVKNIFVEYHSFEGQEQSLPELLTILKKSGFRLNINAPGLVSRNPFLKIETYSGMDMQLNIYGIRS